MGGLLHLEFFYSEEEPVRAAAPPSPSSLYQM